MEGIRVLPILYLIVSFSRINDITGFQFTPRKVFFEVSSRLTLYGEDLSTTNYSDNINVTVCQQPCHNVTNNNGNINCFVEERHFNGTFEELCNVTFSSLDVTEITGEGKLTFVWPQFFNFTPTRGHVSGGTTVTFLGRNLNINRTILITVANATCNIIKTQNRGKWTILLCKTSKSFNATPHCGNVEIAIGNFTPSFMNESFCYHGNPIITEVSPNMTLEKGGTIVTVFGENLERGRRFDWQINSFNIIKQEACWYNRANVLTCKITDLHDYTESYFQNNKSALYVDAQFFLIMDKRVISSPKFIGIHRDPKFKNFSSGECNSSRTTIFIKGQYFSEFISSQVEVTPFNWGGKCQMQYINESYMACHINDDKKTQKDLNGIWDNSKETKAPEKTGRTKDTDIKQESLRSKGITTDSSPASNKLWRRTCPLTIKIGYLKLLLTEIEEGHRDNSQKILMGSVIVSVIVLLVVLVLILVRLRNINILKKEEMNLHLTEAYSEYSRKSSASLKEILDTVVQADNIQDIEKLIIDLDLLTVGKCIGAGNFGCVYEGLLNSQTETSTVRVALKTLQDNYSHNLDLVAFVQEALIMKDFQHPNVMGLIGLAEKEPGVPYVILPFMDKGDLQTYVRDPEVTLTFFDVLSFGADIANGMAYLSSLKLVHRDLAARNCMLDSTHCVKVADFGLCRDIYEKGYYTSDNKKKLPIRWMALESIEHGAYSTMSDVWSLGVVLWEMLTRGLTPYPGVDGWDIVNFLRHRRLPPPYFCPESLYNLMMMCWAHDPIKRPNFETIRSELRLLSGQSSSNVTADGLIDNTNIDQTHDSQSSLENKTPHSRKVSTEQATTLRKSKEKKSVLSKVFLSESTIIDLEEDQTANSITSSGLKLIASVTKPEVLKNVQITMPKCFSEREVSRKSIEKYHYLVDKYETPRTFTSMLSSLQRKLSKRSTEKCRQEIIMRYQIKAHEEVSESSSRTEDKETEDGGAQLYHILMRRPYERSNSI